MRSLAYMCIVYVRNVRSAMQMSTHIHTSLNIVCTDFSSQKPKLRSINGKVFTINKREKPRERIPLQGLSEAKCRGEVQPTVTH